MEQYNDIKGVFRNLDTPDPYTILQPLPSPSYVIDEKRLKENGELLKIFSEKTGCKILLAQKAFSNFAFYPMLENYLAGTEASGLFEARLGKEEMPEKEVHVFCAAYTDSEFHELLQYADHIVFNSPNQLKKFGPLAKEAGKSIGLRINPECSTQDGHAIYDPCAPGSRLGTTRAQFDAQLNDTFISLLDGIHFHTLCEQNADDLAKTLKAVEEKFGDILTRDHIKWLNMGGGHHITRYDYDLPLLESSVRYAKDRFQVEVYLEPGEAVALNAGYLVSRVLDIVENDGIKIAVLDASAACHMPDVIEMPYEPPIYQASTEEISCYCYRLAGPTCLSGDVIGDYYFVNPLKEGDLVIFGDMAIYTTCKNNTFNGMPLPAIYRLSDHQNLSLIKSFDYYDFKNRLS